MGILKKFFWILIVRIISEFWAYESLSKSQNKFFVCTIYNICVILHHICGSTPYYTTIVNFPEIPILIKLIYCKYIFDMTLYLM